MAILLLKSYCHGRKKYLGSHAWLIIFENLPPFSPGSESKLCLKPMSFRQIISLSQAAEEIQSITAVPMHYIIYTWNLMANHFIQMVVYQLDDDSKALFPTNAWNFPHFRKESIKVWKVTRRSRGETQKMASSHTVDGWKKSGINSPVEVW